MRFRKIDGLTIVTSSQCQIFVLFFINNYNLQIFSQRKCRKDNHIPYECDELEKAEKARILIEEKMTEAVLRKCYNCNKDFIKEASNQCNMMHCSCGAKMSYLCDATNVDYLHFNAQGDTKFEL